MSRTTTLNQDKIQTDQGPSRTPQLSIRKAHLPLMGLAVVALLAAMWSGLLRLGWPWPLLQPTLPMAHGPLMVGGFLGTLISLERAVALARPWAYTAPLATGLGALLLIAGVPGWPGPLLITLGSLVTVAIFILLIRLQTTLFISVIGLGALAWLVGNTLWLTGVAVPNIVLWWAGFLVLTIAGERLELSRLLRLSNRVQALFLLAILLFMAGLLVSLTDLDAGMRLAGIGMVALALWLLRYDIARRRIVAGGQARFIAVSLLSGYVWLGIGGVLAIAYGGVSAGPRYDAILHSLFLGYVFTMIFAHAPIIFPAVLRLPIAYTPRFYSHLILLHITLALRIAGDLLSWWPGRMWGGLLNVVVLLLFLVNTATAIRRR